MKFDTALLDVARMSSAERLALSSGISVAALMENAGNAVAREIERRWSKRAVLVLCGPGNNGGDGLVVARRLFEAGWPVRVALLGPKENLKGAAAENARRWPGPIETMSKDGLSTAELVVDAVFGAGFRGSLDGAAHAALAAAAGQGVPIVAVDMPSGVGGDDGEAHGAVAAALTVTFFRKKPGHLLLPGRDLCGELVLAEIGIPVGVLQEIGPDAFENDPCLWGEALPRPGRRANKYTRGHALLVGGYPLTGASRLAARAAARAGAGLTTIAVPPVALPVYAAALTSIMVSALGDAEEFAALLADVRITALLIGPGAGVGEATRVRALAMLATGRPTVIDADAISSFSGISSVLEQSMHGPCVMTPHEGELQRVYPGSGDKLSRARAAAARSGAVIVLKGSDTVIAAPDGRAIINANAPPSLATAGSGDVLSGFLLGLLAQGMDAFTAAAAAVWLHGAAAADFGPGLIAEDLPDLLPRVLRRLYGESTSRDPPGA